MAQATRSVRYLAEDFTANVRGTKCETGNKIIHMVRGHLDDGSGSLPVCRSWPECQGGAGRDADYPDSLWDQ